MALNKQKLHWFEAFVELINERPILWTVSLLIPTYVFAFVIAFAGLALDPHLGSPLLTFLILIGAAVIVMTYHWMFSRFQRTSSVAQAIQFVAGLIPVVGGLVILLVSHLTVR